MPMTASRQDLSTIKERLVERLSAFADPRTGVLRRPARNDNTGPLLAEIHLWQEACKYTREQLEAAWERAQADGGIVQNDEKLRELGEGDHIVSEAGQFSCVVKVSKPAKRFDLEGFLAAVARKYRAKPSDLLKLVEQNKKDGNPSVTKKVLEA